MFKEAGAPELGYAIWCYPDYAMAKSNNRKLERIKTLMFGDDYCYFKTTEETEITTTLSADGTPTAVIEVAQLTWIKGTGQFKNIQGSATAKGRYISKNIYIVELEGEYWIGNG
jgi:hypothetical protein